MKDKHKITLVILGILAFTILFIFVNQESYEVNRQEELDMQEAMEEINTINQ